MIIILKRQVLNRMKLINRLKYKQKTKVMVEVETNLNHKMIFNKWKKNLNKNQNK